MDPVASLRAFEIEIDLGGWVYVVPALWADEWVEVLAEQSLASVLPGLLPPEDKVALWKDLLHGRVTPQDMVDGARSVIEAAGGRKWWEVQRLVNGALNESTWPVFHGQSLKSGVDFSRITLAGFVNLVLVTALAGCEKQADRDKLMWEIEKPPPGFAREVETTSEAEFMMMLGEQERLAGGTPQQMIGQAP